MKITTLAFISIIAFPLFASAQTAPTKISFSVDTKDNKTSAGSINKIESAAKKVAKSKCPKKTTFYASAISINVGLSSNNKYTGNANYTGECKVKVKK